MNEIVITEQQGQQAIDELVTLGDCLRWTLSQFGKGQIYYGHGYDNPWDEVLQLILPVLSLPFDIPEAMYPCRLTRSERATIIDLVKLRVNARIPVAYLTHQAWFCGHEFYVDERVLIPRSPIGELINHHFAGLLNHTPKRILDMCTGSGCIAIACAYVFSDAEVDAVDISSDALEVAQYNIEQHGMLQQVTPLRSDLFNDLSPIKYDLIVSNPPYVDAEDIADMPEEYSHEPQLGLAAGQDGLVLVKRMLAEVADYLTDEGVFICEVGNSMVHLIQRYPEVPFTWLEFEQGGDGVFMLDREQLVAAQHYFA